MSQIHRYVILASNGDGNESEWYKEFRVAATHRKWWFNSVEGTPSGYNSFLRMPANMFAGLCWTGVLQDTRLDEVMATLDLVNWGEYRDTVQVLYMHDESDAYSLTNLVDWKHEQQPCAICHVTAKDGHGVRLKDGTLVMNRCGLKTDDGPCRYMAMHTVPCSANPPPDAAVHKWTP